MAETDFDQQVRMEHYRSNVQVVREIGFIAIRTIITLNSGAFVVLLTFIGNTAAQSKFAVPLCNLKWAMSLFLIGLTVTFAAIAYTYVIAQQASPYPQEPKRTDGWFIPIIVGLTGAAFIAFIVGVAVVIIGVSTA